MAELTFFFQQGGGRGNLDNVRVTPNSDNVQVTPNSDNVQVTLTRTMSKPDNVQVESFFVSRGRGRGVTWTMSELPLTQAMSKLPPTQTMSK